MRFSGVSGSIASAVFLAGTCLSAVLASAPARAGPVNVTFDFNNLCADTSPANNCGAVTTSQNATSTQIASYMTDVLVDLGFTTASVTVTGAVGQQGSDTGNYLADGHIVGPTASNPLTLGNTEGGVPETPANAANDGYIINCNGVAGCGGTTYTDFFIQFNNLTMGGKQYQIASLQFDLQIFPDGSAEQPPDLELWTGANGTGTQLHSPWTAVDPGESSISQASGVDEEAPQLLTNSGLIAVNVAKLTTLDFKDWPSTIGIDNLQLTLSTVPEPGSLALFAFGLLGLAELARRKFTRRTTAQA